MIDIQRDTQTTRRTFLCSAPFSWLLRFILRPTEFANMAAADASMTAAAGAGVPHLHVTDEGKNAVAIVCRLCGCKILTPGNAVYESRTVRYLFYALRRLI